MGIAMNTVTRARPLLQTKAVKNLSRPTQSRQNFPRKSVEPKGRTDEDQESAGIPDLPPQQEAETGPLAGLQRL
jgi:hypothetical protein